MPLRFCIAAEFASRWRSEPKAANSRGAIASPAPGKLVKIAASGCWVIKRAQLQIKLGQRMIEFAQLPGE